MCKVNINLIPWAEVTMISTSYASSTMVVNASGDGLDYVQDSQGVLGSS